MFSRQKIEICLQENKLSEKLKRKQTEISCEEKNEI